MPMLPPWVMENIQDQLVLPRLLQEVENWNPLTDTMPIHSWLHPWLPLMGKCSIQTICLYPIPHHTATQAHVLPIAPDKRRCQVNSIHMLLVLNRSILPKYGVVGWCEGVVYLTSPGRPTDIGLQLGKACYPCSR